MQSPQFTQHSALRACSDPTKVLVHLELRKSIPAASMSEGIYKQNHLYTQAMSVH